MIHATRALEALVGRRGSTALDALLVAALAAYVVLLLAVRGGTNACLLVVFLFALLYWIRQPAAIGAAWRLEGSGTMVAALSSVFLAAIIAKLLRGGIDYIDLDGPSRFWVAALVMLFLIAKRVQFVRIFVIALPFATLAALAGVFFHTDPTNRWSGRFATSFVDPNTLGSYAVILTFLTLLTVASRDDGSPWRRTLPWLGAAAGLLLAMFAASRGAWLAIPPLAALWLYFRWRRGTPRLAWQGLAVLAVLAVIAIAVPDLIWRGIHTGDEIRSWADETNRVTPPGIRLGVWKLGLELYAASPLTGYGWSNVSAQLARPEYAAAWPADIIYVLEKGGPHNDLLTLAISHGVFGIAAFVALLFGPAVFFWRRLRTATGDARLACELGICYAAGILVCGLTNEMLSLKYLASFYGLTVAGLAAQVLGDSGGREHHVDHGGTL